MDLSKNGKLLCDLRKTKGMTQKQVADRLGVLPKTVSKWETGHGFPDVSTVSALADILGVSERTVLSGNIELNTEETGNVKNKRRISSRKSALKYTHTSAAAFQATCARLFHIMVCAALRRNGGLI